jgi:hypothetical protein
MRVTPLSPKGGGSLKGRRFDPIIFPSFPGEFLVNLVRIIAVLGDGSMESSGQFFYECPWKIEFVFTLIV